MGIRKTVCIAALLLSSVFTFTQTKPKLTLDDFFNSVSFRGIELSPDGNSVVFAADRADWDQQIFRTDLWLYRSDSRDGSLIQLTQSGHDSDPKWSPDGKWIAFLSERKSGAGKGDDADSDSDSKDDVSQIFLISPNGGEAFPITKGEEDVHTFSWSTDSQTIYYATRQPWTKEQKDEYKRQWKDVIQYRTAERGDTIFALDVATALNRHSAEAARIEKKEGEPEKQPDLTPGSRTLATIPLRVDDLETSPDGASLAFVTNAINQRQEKYEDIEIFVVDTKGGQPRRITHNEGEEVRPRWANDSRHIFFFIGVGDVAGSYRDLQPHLYWVDINDGKVEQWDKSFVGPVEHYSVTADNVLACARLGTEVQMYDAAKPSDKLHRLTNTPGTYAQFSTTQHSPRVAFVYSSLGKPEEIYLADSSDKLQDARPITSFNKLFTERDLPQGKALSMEGRRRHHG